MHNGNNGMSQTELEERAEFCFAPPIKCFFSLKPLPDGEVTVVDHALVGEVPALAKFGGRPEHLVGV